MSTPPVEIRPGGGAERARGPVPAGDSTPAPARQTRGVGRFAPPAFPAPPGWLARWLKPRYPRLAVQFGRDQILVARLGAGEKGGPLRLLHLSRHALPEGSLTPSLDQPNFASPAQIASALQGALASIPERVRSKRISVALPDACARVVLLTLQDLPRSRRQAAEVLNWHVRKRVPFPLDDARMSVQRFTLADGSRRILVGLAMHRVMSAYEQVFESLGLEPGLLDVSTLNLANGILAAGVAEGAGGDRAVINAESDQFSLLILRDEVPLFHRSRALLHRPEEDPEGARLECQRELMTSAAYYRDRLGGGSDTLKSVSLRARQAVDLGLEDLAADALGTRPRHLATPAALGLAAGTDVPAPDLIEDASPALAAAAGR